MKLLILNGIPNDTKYTPFEQEIEKSVSKNTSCEIDYFRLRDMNINYCQGCWDCWVKTPGRCGIKDDHEMILSRIPNVDMVLYISPVILGYESSILKTCKDRSIGAFHPYISLYKGEQHHIKRYDKMPDISVLLITDEDTTKDDIDLISNTYFRNALNFRKDDKSKFVTIDNAGGVKDVFDRL
ncbi:MAG: flavodoxin family protein [Tenericutes bacterium]|nr:flavodoxin family protein [Mycoplasmatota bacterium]